MPVLRNAEFMSFAEIEQKVADYGRRAKENKLKLEELQGGTFTISNGGVYGSMLSTPIVNPPQSGILGLHAIEDRPAVRDGQVVSAYHDVRRPNLRSPHCRSARSSDVSQADQGDNRRTLAHAAGNLNRSSTVWLLFSHDTA